MNIFLSVGTQEPFDRLVKSVDQWASTQPGIYVIGQIGQGDYIPGAVEFFRSSTPSQFDHHVKTADLIIAHSGMGIILKALVNEKPILVLPRRLELKEVNTNHQIATAKALSELDYIYVAWDNSELIQYLRDPHKLKSKMKIGSSASDSLISSIRDFILQ